MWAYDHGQNSKKKMNYENSETVLFDNTNKDLGLKTSSGFLTYISCIHVLIYHCIMKNNHSEPIMTSSIIQYKTYQKVLCFYLPAPQTSHAWAHGSLS